MNNDACAKANASPSMLSFHTTCRPLVIFSHFPFTYNLQTQTSDVHSGHLDWTTSTTRSSHQTIYHYHHQRNAHLTSEAITVRRGRLGYLLSPEVPIVTISA